MIARVLRRGRNRRFRRMAFWHLGAERLVASVIERTADEPLLVACATIQAEPQTPLLKFAPGILETAFAIASLRLPHAVALDERYCEMVCDDSGSPAPRSKVSVPVGDPAQTRVQADLETVETVVVLFAQARLSLQILDCAGCALLSLRQFFDQAPRSEAANLAVSGPGPGRPDADPLAVVSVTPECEATASRLGRLLSVPVGLALGVFGLVPDAAG